jgi:thiol-disulfide isomerase/thioredoxin
MKRSSSFSLAVIALLVLASPLLAKQKDPEAGDQLPSFILRDQDGKLQEAEVLHADRPLVLSFFARNCGPCKKELPVLQRLHAAHGEKVRIVVVVLDPEGIPVFVPYIKEHSITFTVLNGSGGDIQDLLGIDALPRVLLVARGGLILESIIGFDPSKANEFEAKIAGLAEGSVRALPSTPR